MHLDSVKQQLLEEKQLRMKAERMVDMEKARSERLSVRLEEIQRTDVSLLLFILASISYTINISFFQNHVAFDDTLITLPSLQPRDELLSEKDAQIESLRTQLKHCRGFLQSMHESLSSKPPPLPQSARPATNHSTKLAAADRDDFQRLLVEHLDKHAECNKLKRQLEEAFPDRRLLEEKCAVLQRQVEAHIHQESLHRDSLEHTRIGFSEVCVLSPSLSLLCLGS